MATLADALAGLALPALVGALLPRLKPDTFDPVRAPRLLATLVTEVTLPALSLAVLARRPLSWTAALSVLPALAALFITLALSWLTARALRLDRPSTGALMLAASFSNTAFVGLPMTQAILPGADNLAAALLIDTLATTLGLWTIGVAVAQRFGGGSAPLTLAGVLLRPATLSVLLGLCLGAAGVSLPSWTLSALEPVGAATTPLAFLFLGMRVDLRGAWRSRGPIAAVAALKLVAMPLVAVGVARAAGLPGPAVAVGALQSAMPTALVAAVIAEQAGCDARLAAGSAAVTVPLGVAIISACAPLIQALAR